MPCLITLSPTDDSQRWVWECPTWCNGEWHYLRLWLLLLLLLLSWDALENLKKSLLLLLNLLLGLLKQLLESIQDSLKLGLWNAFLQGCCSSWGCMALALAWQRPSNSFSIKVLSPSFHWAAMITHLFNSRLLTNRITFNNLIFWLKLVCSYLHRGSMCNNLIFSTHRLFLDDELKVTNDLSVKGSINLWAKLMC